jgi:CheY-like chemotaxis protein
MISWARPATGSTWQEVPEAIRAVDANPPALVILDVGLPPDNAGGWTVLAHLRSTAALRSVPMLILTGMAVAPCLLLRASVQDQFHAEEALARGAASSWETRLARKHFLPSRRADWRELAPGTTSF